MPFGKKIRIAVIDDEKLLIHMLSIILKQYSYEADFFSSPVTAIEAITADPRRYDLVMTDVRMPDMDGIRFAKKARAVAPGLPILFMTGQASDEFRAEATQMDRVAFLEKPFPVEATLREFIPKFLGTEPPPAPA